MTLLLCSLLCHQSENGSIYHPPLQWRNMGNLSYQNYEQLRHSDTAPSCQGNFITYTRYALSCYRKPEARPAGGCYSERDHPFTQSEINIRRMHWSYFCASCLHLVNKQANNQIPRPGESGGEEGMSREHLTWQQWSSSTSVGGRGEWQETRWCLGRWECSLAPALRYVTLNSLVLPAMKETGANLTTFLCQSHHHLIETTTHLLIFPICWLPTNTKGWLYSWFLQHFIKTQNKCHYHLSA